MPLPLLLPKLEGKNIDDVPCCLFSRSGALLWRSAYWTRREGWTPRVERGLLGLRYLEFVHVCDVDKLLKFFRSSEEDDVVSFRVMIARTGRTCRSFYYKIAAGPNWFVVVRLLPLEAGDHFGEPASVDELSTYE